MLHSILIFLGSSLAAAVVLQIYWRRFFFSTFMTLKTPQPLPATLLVEIINLD